MERKKSIRGMAVNASVVNVDQVIICEVLPEMSRLRAKRVRQVAKAQTRAWRRAREERP